MLNTDIIRMARAGVQPSLISDQLGVARTTVYSVICTARKRGEDIPHFSRRCRRITRTRLHLTPFIRTCLKAPAEARGLTVEDLAERLLDKIAEDQLVDAILDDGGCDD